MSKQTHDLGQQKGVKNNLQKERRKKAKMILATHQKRTKGIHWSKIQTMTLTPARAWGEISPSDYWRRSC